MKHNDASLQQVKTQSHTWTASRTVCLYRSTNLCVAIDPVDFLWGLVNTATMYTPPICNLRKISHQTVKFDFHRCNLFSGSTLEDEKGTAGPSQKYSMVGPWYPWMFPLTHRFSIVRNTCDWDIRAAGSACNSMPQSYRQGKSAILPVAWRTASILLHQKVLRR